MMRLSLCVFVAAMFVCSCDPPGKPAPPELKPSEITDFKTLFSENCSGCHGANGRMGPGRILNDAVYVTVVPRDTLRNVIANGRPGTAMPAWLQSSGGPLTQPQVDALVDGIERWKTPVIDPNMPNYTPTTPGDATNGKKLFLRGCFACHGPGALVGSVTDASYLDLVTDQNLRTSIIVGRADLGMPDYRHVNAGRALTDQDVTDLVAYLASLRPAPFGNGQQGGMPSTK